MYKFFRRCFPGPFEMFVAGFMLLLASMPGLSMIVIRHDAVFPTLFDFLYDVGVAWGCVTGLLAVVFLFSACRMSSPPGSLLYRLTHPRFF